MYVQLPQQSRQELPTRLNPSACYMGCSEPDVGFPLEMIGKITSQVGCNLHICFPLLCSDSYAYTAFNKLLANTSRAGKSMSNWLMRFGMAGRISA